MIKLNEYGLSVWRHKTNKNLFVERSYEWVDRILVLDETNGRSIINDTKYSTYDFHDWIPVTVEEYLKVKRNFKDIYNEY